MNPKMSQLTLKSANERGSLVRSTNKVDLIFKTGQIVNQMCYLLIF